MTDISEFIKNIDEHIKRGDFAGARVALEKFRRRRVPREFVVDVAALARRAFCPDLALRLLNPFVRPSRKSAATATEREKAEYSASLIRVGVFEGKSFSTLMPLPGRSVFSRIPIRLSFRIKRPRGPVLRSRPRIHSLTTPSLAPLSLRRITPVRPS